MSFWKSIGILLLAVGLLAGPWFASQARAERITHPADSALLQPTPAPTAESSLPGVGEQQPRAWMFLLLTIVCAMGGLLVIGVGAAILLVKIRERL
jgi:hypothetical protein